MEDRKGKKNKNGEVVVIKTAQPPKPAVSPVKSAAYIEPKPVEKPKPVFADSKLVIGAKVVHKAFGSGVIVTVDPADAKFRYVVVRFNDVEKKFQIPNTFLQGFLKFEE